MLDIPTPEELEQQRLKEANQKKLDEARLVQENIEPLVEYAAERLRSGNTCLCVDGLKERIEDGRVASVGLEIIADTLSPRFEPYGWRLEVRYWCDPPGCDIFFVPIRKRNEPEERPLTNEGQCGVICALKRIFGGGTNA